MRGCRCIYGWDRSGQNLASEWPTLSAAGRPPKVKPGLFRATAVLCLAIAGQRHQIESLAGVVLTEPPRNLVDIEPRQTDVDQSNVGIEAQRRLETLVPSAASCTS